MVKYYSIEIREKALEALDKGNKQIDVAKIFGIILNHLSNFTYFILNTSFRFLKKSKQYNANFFNLFFKKDQYCSIGLKSGE
jgi:hypothetical protein